MSSKYDNWEKLVGAVLKREQFRRLALSHSISSCSSSRFDDHLVVCKGQGERSFFLDQDSRSAIGKLVFLPVEARELIIRTEDYPQRHLPYSYNLYNAEAVKVHSALSLDIRGKIRARLLTSKTIYGVYLVFKLEPISIGFETMKGVIRFIEDETEVDAERRGGILHLQAVDEREREGVVAVSYGDGWMEVEIGSFYVDDGDEGEVEARVLETSSRMKTGLIIQGMEFRPVLNSNSNIFTF